MTTLPDTITREGQFSASVMLAKAMGWEILRPFYSTVGRIEFTSINVIGDKALFSEVGDTLAFRGEANFYHQDNMALAWRVLNWLDTSEMGKRGQTKRGCFNEFYSWWINNFLWMNMPPAEAQRAWLDKILELAIEGGLVASE